MAGVSVIIVVLVVLVARVGTVALTLTGMSRESARESGDLAHERRVAEQHRLEAEQDALAR